jgi:hypothetical protein
MQHHSIPTRLLDWTENPFVALYFALSNVARTKVGKPHNDVVVWMSDPVEWNRASLAHISFGEGVLDQTSTQIGSYKPGSLFANMFVNPVMMYGTHNSPRIVAQRGVFALFGQGAESMESVFQSGSFPETALQRMIIKRDLVLEFFNSLRRKGISDSVVYPDLFGLSLELRRLFGFI